MVEHGRTCQNMSERHWLRIGLSTTLEASAEMRTGLPPGFPPLGCWAQVKSRYCGDCGDCVTAMCCGRMPPLLEAMPPSRSWSKGQTAHVTGQALHFPIPRPGFPPGMGPSARTSCQLTCKFLKVDQYGSIPQ